MRKVLISTDSTADLSEIIKNKHSIYSIPLYVRFDDEEFLDGLSLTTEELYEKVSQTGKLPKTAAVSPADFENYFSKYLNQGYDIVHIGIGSKLSATYQNAKLAASVLDESRIHIIDSENLSSGIALLVLKAKDLRNQGVKANEIASQITRLVPLVRSQFAIKTLDYLHKGGRASGTAKLFGSLLKIKPIIQVRNGQMSVYKKTMGKMSNALDLMLNDFYEQYNSDNIDSEYVMITHSMANKSFEYMNQKVVENSKISHLIESHAGCVISSHCGAGTIGILYIVKA